MRKSVVFILSCLLFIPALANAWTLVVSNTNASANNYATVTWTSGPADGVKVAVNGSKNVLITGEEDAAVTYTGTAPIAGAVTVGGVVNDVRPVVVPKPTAGVIEVKTAFSATSVATYALGVTQVPNGLVVLKVGNATTTIGYSNIANGTPYTVVATPNAGYKVTGITIGAGNAPSAMSPLTPAVGQAATMTATANGADTPVVTFGVSPVVIKSEFSLPTAGLDTYAFSASVMMQAIPTSSFTYTWTVTNPSSVVVATGTNQSITYQPVSGATGNYTVAVSATAAGLAAPVLKTGTIAISSGVTNANATCTGCHTNSTPDVIIDYNSNNHPRANVPAGLLCTKCHTTSAHKVGATCVGCHSVNQNLGTGYVADNSGVRAVTGEFAKWSHHVTGVNLNDAHCAACHLEGKVDNSVPSNPVIVVDNDVHMSSATTHLRNADTDADIEWDPATPNHTNMDNFCMSCHDDNGATSTESGNIQALINFKHLNAPGKTASATNPFGDTISNRYDKMERPAVVDAKGQFATGNASHHAVRGAKYTKRSRAAVGGARALASDAAFTANSTAVLYGARTTIFDANKFEASYKTLSPVGATDQTLGDDSQLHCGDCHTVGQWKAGSASLVNGNPTVAVIGAHGSNNEYLLRNSIGTDERHVGVTYTSASGVNTVTNAGAPYLVCFNCHVATTYNSIGNSTNTAGTNHAGEYANSNRCNGPINTIPFAGYTTSLNNTEEPYAFRLGLGYRDGISTGSTSTSDTDFSNLFGMQCANCHNSGPDNGFGGIHGSKVNVYTDANGAQQAPRRFLPGLGNTMFVPGSLGPKKGYATIQDAYSSSVGVGSVSNFNWEQKMLGTTYSASTVALGGTANGTVAGRSITSGGAVKNKVTDNSGCYTLVPESGETGTAFGHAKYDISPTFEQKNSAGQTLFGEWGGCDDHRGNASGKSFAQDPPNMDLTKAGYPTVNTGGAGVTRKVLRPVSY